MAQRGKARRRSRRRGRNRIFGWAARIAAICCLIFGLMWGLMWGLIWFGRAPEPKRAAVNYTDNAYVAGFAHFSAAPPEFSGSDGERLHVVVFPYSVIPGGARDTDELRLALARDPVAAAHYASFDVGHTRVVQLSGELDAYVSYRLGDHIFWTSRKLKIRTGETLLTDGQHFARTRCGNQLAEIPPGPTAAPQEPGPEMFDTPLPLELAPLRLLEIEAPPADEPLVAPPTFLADERQPSGGIYLLPSVSSFPPVGGGADPALPVPPASATPEPDVLLLFAAGLASLLLLGRGKNRRRGLMCRCGSFPIGE